MDRVCDAHDHERSFGGEGQNGIGGVEASSGSFLYLLDSGTTFADDGADEDGRDK